MILIHVIQYEKCVQPINTSMNCNYKINEKNMPIL